MDILDLAEVAELLGEPQSTILAACERFPNHVPTYGADAWKRFPSVALDVLRLITDAMTAGSPPEATIHLIETHFPEETTHAFGLDEEPERPLEDLDPVEPLLPDPHDEIVVDAAADDQAATIMESIQAGLAPVMRTFDAALLTLRSEMTGIRERLALTARADDLDLLRVETRGIAVRRAESVATDLRLQATLTAIDDAVDETRRELSALRHEVAVLRAQFDYREELAELRAEVQRLDWIGRRGGDSARPPIVAVPSEPTPPRGLASSEPPSRSELNPSAITDESPPGGLSETRNGASLGPPDDSAPTRITRFAARTPRRMGRSLLADEV